MASLAVGLVAACSTMPGTHSASSASAGAFEELTLYLPRTSEWEPGRDELHMAIDPAHASAPPGTEVAFRVEPQGPAPRPVPADRSPWL
jgi:hypothetical protein